MTNPSEAQMVLNGREQPKRIWLLCYRHAGDVCWSEDPNPEDDPECESVEYVRADLAQQAATPAAPVQDDDAELVNQLNRLIDGWNGEGDLKVGPHMLAQGLVEARDAIANRLTPDRVTPCQECENLKHDLERVMKRENDLLNRVEFARTALREGTPDA